MNYVDQNIFDHDSNLDTFELITGTSESIQELVKRELLIFRKYQWMLMTSNVFFNGGRNMRQCFL
jgi:hypothetical protein